MQEPFGNNVVHNQDTATELPAGILVIGSYFMKSW
jgi:hypothetical protein